MNLSAEGIDCAKTELRRHVQDGTALFEHYGGTAATLAATGASLPPG